MENVIAQAINSEVMQLLITLPHVLLVQLIHIKIQLLVKQMNVCVKQDGTLPGFLEKMMLTAAINNVILPIQKLQKTLKINAFVTTILLEQNVIKNANGMVIHKLLIKIMLLQQLNANVRLIIMELIVLLNVKHLITKKSIQIKTAVNVRLPGGF